jgi:catechol 2,3-dioxygenase-like lactoylglutathione lyase family enzyme
MIDHLSTYATDYEKTRAFYDAVLPGLGYPRGTEMQTTWDPEWPTRRMCAYGPEGRHVLWLIEVREAVSPRHVAFAAKDRSAVDAFHAAALANGGVDHGAPGPRPHYHESYYGAFALDPDGNNVEAVCHTA